MPAGLPGQFLVANVTTALGIKASALRQSKDESDTKPVKCEVTFDFQAGALLRELPFPESFALIFIADRARPGPLPGCSPPSCCG